MRSLAIVVVGVLILGLCVGVCGEEQPKPPLPMVGDETPLTLVRVNVKDYIGRTFIVVGGVEVSDSYNRGYENAQDTHVSLSLDELRADWSRTRERLYWVYLRRDRSKPLVDAVVENVAKGFTGKIIRAKLTFLPERYDKEGGADYAELLDWQFLSSDQKSWGPWVIEASSTTVKSVKDTAKPAVKDTNPPEKDEPIVVTTLKYKETDEIIKGTLTKQKINKLTVFKLADGKTKFIDPDEWEVLARETLVATTASVTTPPSASVPDYSLPTPLEIVSRVGKHFGGIPWGTDIKDVAGMQPSLKPFERDYRAKHGEGHLLALLNQWPTRTYERTSDRMNIGQAKVEKIVYTFYRGRFYCAEVTFRGVENWKWLKNELSVRYGPGTDKDTLTVWGFADLDSKTPEVAMELEWDSSQKCGSLHVFHVPTSEEVKNDPGPTPDEAVARIRNGDTTSNSEMASWQLLADANLAFSKGDYDKAIILLERLLADKTIDPDVRLSATSVLTSCHMMKQMKE